MKSILINVEGAIKKAGESLQSQRFISNADFQLISSENTSCAGNKWNRKSYLALQPLLCVLNEARKWKLEKNVFDSLQASLGSKAQEACRKVQIRGAAHSDKVPSSLSTLRCVQMESRLQAAGLLACMLSRSCNALCKQGRGMGPFPAQGQQYWAQHARRAAKLHACVRVSQRLINIEWLFEIKPLCSFPVYQWLLDKKWSYFFKFVPRMLERKVILWAKTPLILRKC